MARNLHGADDVHDAAAGIFDLLPDEPFGEGEGVEDLSAGDGESPEGLADTMESMESEEQPEPEPITDDEAAEAMSEAAGDEEDEEAQEADETDEDTEDEAEDEEADETSEEPDAIPVKVDGEEIKVSLQELKDGYSRTASWTRKSQALAEERRAFEAEREEITKERAALAMRLKAVEEDIQSKLPKEPDSRDPQAWIEYQKEVQRLQAAQQERQALDAKLAADYEARKMEWAESERAKLPEMIPEWKEPEAMQKGLKSLATYAAGLGIPDEVLANFDSLAVNLLWKAQQYDSLEDARKTVKTKAKAAPTLKPGAKKSSKTRKSAKAKRQEASQRDKLRKTGHVRDAADLIYDQFLDD